MPILFRCLHCDAVFAAPDELAGRRARCQGCRGVVSVPFASLGIAALTQSAASLAFVPTGMAAGAAGQSQLQPLGRDPLLELLGPRPIQQRSGIPAGWIVGGGMALAGAVVVFGLITWGMNRGRLSTSPGNVAANSGDRLIARAPAQPAPATQSRGQRWLQSIEAWIPESSNRSASRVPPSGGSAPAVPADRQVASSNPSHSISPPAPSFPPAPSSSPQGEDPFRPVGPSSATSPNSNIPSPAEVSRANVDDGVWSLAPDPSPGTLELKKGDFKIPLNGPRAQVIFPKEVSRFVMAWTGDSSRPECTMYDLKTGQAIGEKISLFGLQPEKTLVSPDGRYVTVPRLDEGTEENRVRIATVSFATGQPQPRIDFKCGQFHKALFGGAHRLVTAHSLGKRFASQQTHFLTVWDVQTGEALREIDLYALDAGHEPRLELLEISPGGKYAVYPCDREIVFIDLEAGHVLERVPLSTEARGQARLLFSPDGKLLASVEGMSFRADLRVFEISSGRVVVEERIEMEPRFLAWQTDDLSWLPNNRGLFVSGQVLLELTSARQAWTFPRSRGEPRRILREGEMITLGADRNRFYLYSAPLPQKQISAIFDGLRVSTAAWTGEVPAAPSVID